MNNYIPIQPAQINPVAVYPYWDKVQLWFEERLSQHKLREIADLCGGKLHYDNKPMRYHSQYKQRLQINQPSPELLSNPELNAIPMLINWTERGLEWVYDNEEDRDHDFWWLSRHHIKKNHRDQAPNAK